MLFRSSFGSIFSARNLFTNELVIIKTTLQNDLSLKNEAKIYNFLNNIEFDPKLDKLTPLSRSKTSKTFILHKDITYFVINKTIFYKSVFFERGFALKMSLRTKRCARPPFPMA